MAQALIILSIWLLALSLVVGQLVRIPVFGQSGGLLLSDLAVALVLLVTLARILTSRAGTGASLLVTRDWLLFTPFIIWSAFTLIIHLGDYTGRELLIAGAYWLRTSAYLLLLPALAYLARHAGRYTTLRRSFVAALLILILGGFGQLVFMPRLADMPSLLIATSGGGWDPHEGRLVATWLDPNFFGAYAAIGMMYTAACAVASTNRRHQLFFVGTSIAAAAAVILTQSRSATIALATTLGALSPLLLVRFTQKKASATLIAGSLALGSLACIGLLAAALALGDRALGVFTFDETVQQRAEALAAAGRLAVDHIVLGVGYNAWQFVAQEANLIQDTSLHSRAGVDNSWLMLLATTGFIGVALCMLPWLVMAQRLAAQWLHQGQPQAVAALGSLLLLAVHAQFINSWLYGHLLITISIIIALALVPAASHEKPLLN